jgi:hypothetical protein
MGGAIVKTVFRSLAGAVVLLSVISTSAAAQTTDPSDDIYNQLLALRDDLRPTLIAARRWTGARDVGLSAQPGEFESIHAQLITLQVRADQLLAQSNSDTIDAHVKRAAEATDSEIQAFLMAVDTNNSMYNDPMVRDRSTAVIATQEYQKEIQIFLKQSIAFTNVANDEMWAYYDAYTLSHPQ